MSNKPEKFPPGTKEQLNEIELPDGVHSVLVRLKTDLAAKGEGRVINDLDGISCTLGNLFNEQKGMVDELLGVYEQLGIVFELTRSLADTETEWEVLALFIKNLSQSFPQCTIAIYAAGRTGYRITHGARINVPDLEDRITEAIQNRSAIVHAKVCDEYAELLLAPILSGNQLCGCIIMTRPHDAPEFRASDMSVISSLSMFCGDLVRNQRLMENLRVMAGTIVQALVNAIDQKDEYTAGHSTRVAFYADMLGNALELPTREQRMLQWSALLHDIGKIGIRDDVLKKQGPLTDDEFDHMKEHPVRSHEVVRDVPHLADALDGVRYHHERFDGKGYPSGLSGESIPLQARIVQIADVFDALTSSRSYRSAFTWQKALSIMEEEAGATLDPNLQQRFDALIRELLATGNESWDALTERAAAFTTATPPKQFLAEDIL